MGCFEIRRAQTPPPDSLLQLIWPGLSKWAGKFGPGPGQVNDLAAAGFTGLLFYLREVILEDSALLMRRFPECAVWSHPVFQHQDYVPYASQVVALIEEDERPSQLAILTQALPVLTDYLKAAEARREAQAAELSAALTAEIHTAKEQLATAYRASIQTFLADSVFQLAPAPAPAPAPELVPVPVPVPQRLGELVIEEGGLCSRSISPGVASSSAEDSECSLQSGGVELGGAEPPKHRMSRAVKTVQDLWREWTVGLRGGPSVTALDSR